MSEQPGTHTAEIAASGARRLFLGQTSIDFFGRRIIGAIVSSILLLVTVVSLFAQGLNLGIDFEGGTSWDVPANVFTVADADVVLTASSIDTEGSRIQLRDSDGGAFVKVQVRAISDAQARVAERSIRRSCWCLSRRDQCECRERQLGKRYHE
jgi:preprotein translocase subunit SecF